MRGRNRLVSNKVSGSRGHLNLDHGQVYFWRCSRLLELMVLRRHSLHEVGMLQRSAQIVSTQSLPLEMGDRFRSLGKPAVAHFRLAGSAPHKNGGRRVKSWPDHTHKQINKKQTSIRCNHTDNTRWVHLKCTQIKQRQDKRDWICTIHSPTQNVPKTLSTAYHKQPKDKNIVILQININGIRNKI